MNLVKFDAKLAYLGVSVRLVIETKTAEADVGMKQSAISNNQALKIHLIRTSAPISF